MKRLHQTINLALFLGLLLCLPVLTLRANAMTGTGTQADPYVLMSPADLAAMHKDLTAHYALGADINLSGYSHTPIGNAVDGPFTGSLDGRGHTISNLTLDLSGTKFVGLFGYMEGSVKGVKLSNVSISGGRYVGGIAGNAGFGSSITDCHVLSGRVSVTSTRIDLQAGGIVGLCEGTLSDCSNAAQIYCNDYLSYSASIPSYTGGIIGRYSSNGGAVNNCTNRGNVDGRSDYAGGIIGYTEGTVSLSGCQNHGGVTGTGYSYAGGMVGYAKNTVSLFGCQNHGGVTGHYNAGGIIGYAAGTATLEDCENGGRIAASASSYEAAGGMIGYAASSSGVVSLARCKNAGKIVGYYAAGMSKYVTSASACENAGALVGYNNNSSYTYPLIYSGSLSSDSKSVVTYCSIGNRYISNINESAQISLSTLPALSSSQFRDTLAWTSSDESVATVDQNGVVTGHSWGKATITVTTAGLGLSSSCTVTVAPELKLEPSSLTLELGDSCQLTPVRTPDSLEYEDSYTWHSGSPSSVTVDANGVVAVKSTSSNAMITVTSVKSGRTATCKVYVVSQRTPAQSIQLDQNVLRPVTGELVQLTATVLPSDASDKTVTWESSDPSVATVSSVGAVRAVAPGEAIITARTANGLYDTCQVKVGPISSAAFVIPVSRGSVSASFDTTVHLVKNPGIAAFTLAVKYDADMMTPTAVTAGELLSGGILSSNVDSSPNGTLRVTWYSAENMTGDGALFTVTWIAKNSTGSTPITLAYDLTDICNEEKLDVRVSAENGTAYILDRPVGDIYHDGLVNMKDIVYFARYFNGLETLDSKQQLAADLFYDSSIDVKDLTALAQLLSENMPQAAQAQPLSLLSTMALTDDPLPFTISVSDATVEDGKDTLVTVNGSNCPGVSAMRLRLHVPKGFEVTSVQPAGLLKDSGTFAYNAETGVITWYSDADRELNGELFTLLLKKVGSVSVPCAVTLEHLEEDFFSATDYAQIPVAVNDGLLSLPPFAELGEVSVSAAAVTVAVNTNMEDQVLLVAAFYQDGKLVCSVLRETPSSGTYRFTVPTGTSSLQCKAFLLDRRSFIPLAACKELRVR